MEISNLQESEINKISFMYWLPLISVFFINIFTISGEGKILD